MINTKAVLFCSSPSSSSSSSSINGNSSHRNETNGKDTKETLSNNDTDKPKKLKPEKPVKTSNAGIKTSNSVNKLSSSSNKRPSDDDEVLPKVKKKRKKIESPQINMKSNAFIPIEPPVLGEEEQHHLGNGKDVKLKIKSLPSSSSKISKKPAKQVEKNTEKNKEKKKEKLNSITDLNLSNFSTNGDTSKRKSVSNSKTKVKSPQEQKQKVSKAEERKVEKLMFRRESGDSWSSSTSSNSPGLPLLACNVMGKNNALGTLMAELSDQDYDDDDEDDIDISTPFQNDSYNSIIESSLSNNNVLNKKDIKSNTNKPKGKTKEVKDTKKDVKEIKKSTKNGHSSLRSPSNAIKGSETSKLSSKTR